MRLASKRRHTAAGTRQFIAHVSDSLPEEPNFRPAMKTTFGTAGRRPTAASSSRSHVMVSTSWA